MTASSVASRPETVERRRSEAASAVSFSVFDCGPGLRDYPADQRFFRSPSCRPLCVVCLWGESRKMGEGAVVKWTFDVTEMKVSCKIIPTIAADHAKKTPAYDKHAIRSCRQATTKMASTKCLRHMAKHNSVSGRTTQLRTSTYVPKHDSFNMGLSCYYQAPDKDQPKKKRTGRTTRSGGNGRRHGCHLRLSRRTRRGSALEEVHRTHFAQRRERPPPPPPPSDSQGPTTI